MNLNKALIVGAVASAAAFSTITLAQDPAKKAAPAAAKAATAAKAAPVAKAAPAAAAGDLKDVKSKASYAIGLNIGRNLKRQGFELDPAAMAKGIVDAFTSADGKFALTDAQCQEAIESFQAEVNAKQMAVQKEAFEKNKKEGDAFLAANKTKEGVKTLASGLQYKVLKEGTGESPKAADEVKTNYRGTLIDGTEFDSSYKRGEPSSFQVDQVISGWTEALQLMKVGSKWQVFLPSNLAYGERGSPPAIGPNATLIFEIELLGIKK